MCIWNFDFSSMDIYDGFAECKSKSKTSPAVCNLIRPGIKSFKNMFFHFIGNSRSVICNWDYGIFPFSSCPDINMGSLLRIFDRIIHQIDDHLHDQPGIHSGQKQFVLMLNRDRVFIFFPVYMAKCLLDHIIHQFYWYVQIHPTFLQSGHGQHIFNQIDQPHRVIINIRKCLSTHLIIHFRIVCHQISGTSRNRCKGRS